MPRCALRRLAAVLAMLVASVSATTTDAVASAATHVRSVATPLTVKVSAVVSVTGTVLPAGTASVVLQRLVGKRWVALSHGRTATSGTYALAVRAPAKPTTLTLRVVRPATSATKAGVGPTLHVRVVRTAFTVTAHPVSTASPVVVTGTVTPKGTGRVSLDRLVKGRWTSIGKATLSKTSTYRFKPRLAVGAYTLRVSKPATRTVAGGVSRTLHVVAASAGHPVVTTTSLPRMTAGRPVSTKLSAKHGTGPYSWAVVAGALPDGLVLLPDGTIGGAPTTVALTTFTVRVTDTHGRSGTGAVKATVDPVVVRAWGDNSLGQLGNGTQLSNDGLTTAALPGTVNAISVGQHYAMALLTDGTVYAWGDNSDGTLGLGDTAPRATPTKVPGLSGIASIAAGYSSAYAVTAAGTVYAWGRNYAGELADGSHSTAITSSPQLVPTLSNVVAVAASNEFALALEGDGTVRSWGYGAYGTLGNRTTDTQQTTPVPVSSLSGVVRLAASGTAAYALRGDGTVRAWGLKEHGQLGSTTFSDASPYQTTPVVVTGVAHAVALSCNGFEFCLARNRDGTVSAWGYGSYGELGLGPSNADALTAVTVPALAGVVDIATNRATSYAVRADGSVLSWGYDSLGQLGNGDPTHTATSSPSAVPGVTGAFAVAGGDNSAFVLRAD